MKIRVEYPNNPFTDSYLLYVNSECELSVGNCSEYPEDANLARDYSDCTRVHKLMMEAYEAGKRGELLDMEYKIDGKETKEDTYYFGM